MNWLDGILIMLLLATVIVGSKKGLVREFMAFIVFFAAIVISVNYIDDFAVWVNNQLSVSPLLSAWLSFIILTTLSYTVFKLLGKAFYKMADLKKMGKRDQLGGALVGFLRGWVTVSFLTFLTFLLPMPDAYYTSFSDSFFGPAMAKTVPLMFEKTAAIHPANPSFMRQMENTLLNPSNNTSGMVDEDRQAVHRALRQFDLLFNPEN